MKHLLTGIGLLALGNLAAQPSKTFTELKRYLFTQTEKTAIAPSSFLNLYDKQGLNYLLPLENSIRLSADKKQNDPEQLIQALSFVGDIQTLQSIEKSGYRSIPDSVMQAIQQLADVARMASYTDARSYILNRVSRERVVMINDAYDKPRTRAFMTSLLQGLYDRGFHTLAMEMLDPHNGSRPLTRLTTVSGFFSNEPMAGELIRTAISIGYQVVPYEDTIARHTVNQREYAQAYNLSQWINSKDSSSRLLVYAGFDHIEEGAAADGRIPMAAYFKVITGIDPLTIDQTQMTENSTTADGAALYEKWIRLRPPSGPVVPVVQNQAWDPFGLHLYDIHVIHPATQYIDGRPDWLSLEGLKKPQAIIPAYRTCFLVQAYYLAEWDKGAPGYWVPADQTYLPAQNGLYYLYLQPGKYKISFRDKNYALLGV
ncbi:MAG TPA: hypothetical protein VG842_01170, partial [Sediminibacterium sp.]|nr:hypothetical protein [Sediminibacterium sp.]